MDYISSILNHMLGVANGSVFSIIAWMVGYVR